MLDSSAAFDVLDHDILHKRLEHTFCITDNALLWIKSYMSERTQRISIGSKVSNPLPLDIGVPQGSVLGPKIYCIFSRPLTEICLHHGMQYHVYAEDTQVYLIVEPTENWQDVSSRPTRCLNDMKLLWMSNNMLELNEEKTELIVFAPRTRIKNLSETSLLFGKNIIHSVPSVRNLGAFFDQLLSFEKQCNAVSRTCYSQIRKMEMHSCTT